MSRKAWNNLIEGIFATFIAIVLYTAGIISVWGLVAFLLVTFLIFGIGYWWKGRHTDERR